MFFLGINNHDQIVGCYFSPSGYNGFLKTGDTFTPIYGPDGSSSCPFGINDSGQITGHYYSGMIAQGSFIKSGDIYTTADFPGALVTYPNDINNNGDIAGFYKDSSNVYHGYVKIGDTFFTIDVPDASTTYVYGINDDNALTGYYWDSSYNQKHGFIATPTNNEDEDRDFDGVPDDIDECPDVFGMAQNNGCPVSNRPVGPATSDLALVDTNWTAFAWPGAGWNLPALWWDFYANARITNLGPEESKGFSVKFTISGHNRVFRVEGLEPGESVVVGLEPDIAGRGLRLQSGEYTLTVIVDYGNLISETDESNNGSRTNVELSAD